MAVTKIFWDNYAECGSLDCVDFAYRGKDYQAVGDHGDGTYTIWLDLPKDQGGGKLIAEYPSLEALLDGDAIEGVKLKDIFEQIEPDDFSWT